MGNDSKIYFVPYRGNFTRGIFTSIYMKFDDEIENIKSIYKDFYESHPFTFLSKNDINLKEVINTNNCLISVCNTKYKNRIILLSSIDNLIKGGAGQAVQNMNIKFGFNDFEGLR